MTWNPYSDESIAPLGWYERWLDTQDDAASEYRDALLEPDREPEQENQP